MASKDSAIEIVCELVKIFEGFRASPYLCPAGIATIGYGSTRYINGDIVTLRDAPITKQFAEILMIHHIERISLPSVLMLCPVEMTDGQLAALTDFAYNLGAARLKTSTLRRYVNAGLWSDVPAQLERWVYAGNRKLKGLIARRKAEIALL